MKNDIVTQAITALTAARTPENLKGSSLSTPAVRKISGKLYQRVKHEEKAVLFDYCEQLLATHDHAMRLIAFDWAFRRRKQAVAEDFSRFEHWLKQYVDDWGSCDDFCVHAFGDLVYRYSECVTAVTPWTQSQNRWLRRAAAVVLIYAARRQALHQEAFKIADALLHDQDDLVQKGYGWLLKEVSNHDPQAVFEFVMARRATMPRTALRYAIEKLEPELRKQAMARVPG